MIWYTFFTEPSIKILSYGAFFEKPCDKSFLKKLSNLIYLSLFIFLLAHQLFFYHYQFQKHNQPEMITIARV